MYGGGERCASSFVESIGWLIFLISRLTDVPERGVASIGVRSSGNLCVDEEYA